MSREEIIAVIQECAQKLGRAPKATEVEVMCPGAGRRIIRRRFGGFRSALEACGLEANGAGFKRSTRRLFEDWAKLVRELKRCPSMNEYEAKSQFSLSPLVRKYKSWCNVPQGMEQFMVEEGLADEYGDVLEMIRSRPVHSRGGAERRVAPRPSGRRPPLPNAGPVIGIPLTVAPLVFAPMNESGVLVLFGMLAERLGYIVTRVQTGFPDCLALLKLDEATCQMVRLEMEYESRNFVEHGHPVKGCDMIVCWIHNWKDCPLPVLELRPIVMEFLNSAGTQGGEWLGGQCEDGRNGLNEMDGRDGRDGGK